MNRIVAFGLIGPVTIALLGTFVYLPGVIYLSGQTSVGADTYEVAFVLFLIMGLVPQWLNLVVVAGGGIWPPQMSAPTVDVVVGVGPQRGLKDGTVTVF